MAIFRRAWLALFLGAWGSMISPLSGQKLSVGVVGGVSLTDGFTAHFGGQDPHVPSFRSANRSVVVGPALEYALTRSFSLEVNALYKALHARGADVGPGDSFPIVTWQFPVLAKFGVPIKRSVNAFVEAGPSFRTAGNLNGTNPSGLGATAGAGVELASARWSISPTIRYTRWRGDQGFGRPVTKSDQIEALVKFSHQAAHDSRPFGAKLLIGILMGTTLSPDYRPVTSVFQLPVPSSDPTNPDLELVTEYFRSGPKSFLVGPTIELPLWRRLSLEASALYRKRKWEAKQVRADGSVREFQRSKASTVWEAPLLLKLAIPLNDLRPFLGAGPAFRTFGTANEPRHGFAAAAGIELAWSLLRIAPQVRYTRWATNEIRVTPADQVQLIVGISF